MNPNQGEGYGKFFSEKDMEKKFAEFAGKADGAVRVVTQTKEKPEIPPQDWPRFQVGEKFVMKGHVWRVTEIYIKRGILTIKPVEPAP